MPPRRAVTLPPNITRLIYTKANKRTQARMQVASKTLRENATLRRPKQGYLEGTGKHQRLWNVDRAIRRFYLKHADLEFLYSNVPIEHYAEFVRRAKELYKTLARQGIVEVTETQFWGARAFFEPHWTLAYHHMDAVYPENGDPQHTFAVKQRYFPVVERVAKNAFKAFSTGQTVFHNNNATYPLETIMDAILLFGKAVLDHANSLLTRKQRRSTNAGATKTAKNHRRLEHAWAGILLTNDIAFGTVPGPEWRRVVKERAAARRVAARAARRV